MVEYSRYASRRSDDGQPRAGTDSGTGGTRPSSDPLAELARLIGRDDPFAELREAGQAQRREPGTANARQRGEPASARSARDVAEGPTNPQWRAGRYRDAGRDEPPAPPAQQFVNDPQYQDSRYQDQQYSDQQYQDQQHLDQQHPQYRDHAADPRDRYAPAHDGRDDAPPPVAGDYEADADYGDDQSPPDGEDTYAPRERRRGGLMTVAAVTGIVALLIGGAFGYRALSGRIGSPGQPPVIVADSSPSKLVPLTQDGQPSKSTYDRASDRSQEATELVAREEKPVDPRGVATRQILPGQPVTTSPASTAAPSANPAVATEPKKVRTVTIRPDQAPTAETPDSSSPWPAPPAVRSVTTTPVPAAPAPAARAAARPAPAPGLTIGAQSPATDPNDAARAAAPARTASVAPIAQPVRAPEAGGYVVQLFSGRSEGEAQDQFRALQGKYQSLLGGRQPIIRRADLGEKGVFYRAQVGPFATIALANEFCGSLKAAGGLCIVQRN